MVLQILFDLPEFLFGIFVFTLAFGEAFLEFKNALAEAFANFGEPAAKNKQTDAQNDGPFKRTWHAKSELKGVKVDMSIPLGRSSVRRTHPSVVRSVKPMRHIVLIALSGLIFSGCQSAEKVPEEDLLGKYERPLPPGPQPCRRSPPPNGPMWARITAAIPPIWSRLANAHWLGSTKRAPRRTSPSRAFPTPTPKRRWNACCNCSVPHEPVRHSPEPLRRDFDCYMSIGCDDEGTVLFTGYCSLN